MTVNMSDTPGGPKLSDGDLTRIAKLIKADAGIELPQGKTSLVQARLSRRLRSLKISTYSDYCDFVESRDGGQERLEMLSALTTNVTKFFRENHHFDDLKNRILPPLLEKARRGGSVRLWSAGCSSGEEPYSMAMTILDVEPKAADLNIRILATDIDPNIINKAKTGVYRIANGEMLSNATTTRYFNKKDASHHEMSPNVKKLITFNRLNLHADWPMKSSFDVIFCRNVVIYFDKSDEIKMWKRMINILNRDGYIMTGHSERIPPEAGNAVTLDGITTYRKLQ